MDIIDGYFLAGFRIVPDPSLLMEFPHVGTFTYGIISYGSYTDYEWQVVNGQFQEVPVNFLVPIMGKVFFPADTLGATTPAQLSTQQSTYSMIVLIHGMGSSYASYDTLLKHLANNGFIAVAIHCEHGMGGMSRARLLFDHLPTLKAMFGTRLYPRIGLIGHSRGGEAVVFAARLNYEQNFGYALDAIVSIAPTNQYAYRTPAGGRSAPSLEGQWAAPYLVLYGAMDEDVSGGNFGSAQQTGFALYDRVRDARRCMVFVYGATHFGFLGRTPTFGSKLGQGTDQAQLLQPATQELIAKAYSLAFFRQHLYGDIRWAEMLKGEWMPAAVKQAENGKARLYVQYGEQADSVFPNAGSIVVDDFEGAQPAPAWRSSTLGGAGSVDAILPADPIEDKLYIADSYSPHETSGLVVQWSNLGDSLRFIIPSAYRDVSKLSVLSFRITQKVGSTANLAGQPQDLYIVLTDDNGKSRSVKMSKFGEVPAPQIREIAAYTKSAMRTVRIPLHAFSIQVLNTDRVNLTNVISITFWFGVNMSGVIEIDTIEFV